MTPLVIGLVVLAVLLLLAAVYSRANPRELVKGIRFSGGVLLGLVTVALAITGRVGLAFLAAAGAWALLTGIASRPAEPASGDASRRSRASSRRPVRPYCSTSLRHASDAS